MVAFVLRFFKYTISNSSSLQNYCKLLNAYTKYKNIPAKLDLVIFVPHIYL